MITRYGRHAAWTLVAFLAMTTLLSMPASASAIFPPIFPSPAPVVTQPPVIPPTIPRVVTTGVPIPVAPPVQKTPEPATLISGLMALGLASRIILRGKKKQQS